MRPLAERAFSMRRPLRMRALRLAAYGGEDLAERLNGYVETLRRHAYRVQDRDIARPNGTGYSEVCALFNTINRVADGLDFALPTTTDRALNTRVLRKVGYR